MVFKRAIGLMSGTSLDGVDVALLETDGDRIHSFGPTGYRAYSDGERALLRQALADAVAIEDRVARPGALAEAERLVTNAHAQAVEQFWIANGLASRDVDIAGFHGQTVLHRPEARLTVQIGDGAALARRLGIPVIFDLRATDVAAGGEGAPLVPVYHRALVEHLDRPHPIAVLNIGGVANITYCDGLDAPIACDTGPGNALIDDFMRARTGQPSDRNGEAAATGRADENWIARFLRHPYFAARPPKSLDRNAFGNADLRLSEAAVADGAATLTALTAATVARVVPHLPQPPRAWIIAGGGARNPTLMRMLGERLAPAAVETAEAVGWSADALEAQAFAFLAVRRLRGLPITFPTTTGAPRPMTGGMIAAP